MAREAPPWDNLKHTRGGPASSHVVVTKSDSASAPVYESFLVISAGNVTIRDLHGVDVTYDSAPAYTPIPVSGRLRSTGTASTKVVGFLP